MARPRRDLTSGAGEMARLYPATFARLLGRGLSAAEAEAQLVDELAERVQRSRRRRRRLEPGWDG